MDNVELMEAQLLAETTDVRPIHDVLEINAETRTISVPSSELLFGVATDQDVERKHFRCPKIVGDNIDLSKLGLRIHYQNAVGKKDKYIIDDIKSNGDYITFSWLLNDTVLAVNGTVSFAVIAVQVLEDGTKKHKWNTTLATGTVLGGLEVDDLDYVEETEARDVLQQLLNLMDTEVNDRIAEVQNECATQVQNVKDEGATQISAVKAKGAATLETIPDDYTEMYNTVRMLDRFTAPVIRQEAEGELVSVSDSSKNPLLGLKVYGKGEQFTTTGKNLLDATIDNAITLDGYDNFVCNNNEVRITNVALFGFKMQVEYGVNYSISFKKLIVDGVFHFRIYEYSGEPITIDPATDPNYIARPISESCVSVAEVTHLYTPPSEGVTWIAIGFYTDATNTIRELQVENGDVVTEYEPYTGEKPAPNYEYPQEVIFPNNGGTINTRIVGKNLLREAAIPASSGLNGITATYEGNGIFHITGTFNGTTGGTQLATTYFSIPIDPDSPYTLSCKLLEGSLPIRFHPFIGLKSDSISFRNWVSVYMNPEYTVGTTYSFTEIPSRSMHNPTHITRFWIYSHNDTLEAYTADFRIQVWLEKGDKTTQFEPYTEQNLPIAIEEGLLGIPVDSGGNYVDENGKEYICDEIDYERGVYIQRIYSKTFDGTETLYNTWYPNVVYNIESSSLYMKNGTNICCNYTTDLYVGNLYGSTIAFSNADKHGFASADEMKDFMIEKYEAGDPVKVYGILAKPIETPLTDDEILTFKSLHTNYVNTKIFNDSGAYMKVTYAADTKIYIDNKFAELQSVITGES